MTFEQRNKGLKRKANALSGLVPVLWRRPGLSCVSIRTGCPRSNPAGKQKTGAGFSSCRFRKCESRSDVSPPGTMSVRSGDPSHRQDQGAKNFNERVPDLAPSGTCHSFNTRSARLRPFAVPPLRSGYADALSPVCFRASAGTSAKAVKKNADANRPTASGCSAPQRPGAESPVILTDVEA